MDTYISGKVRKKKFRIVTTFWAEGEGCNQRLLGIPRYQNQPVYQRYMYMYAYTFICTFTHALTLLYASLTILKSLMANKYEEMFSFINQNYVRTIMKFFCS